MVVLDQRGHVRRQAKSGGLALGRDDEQPPGQIAGPFGRELASDELARSASSAQERQDDRSSAQVVVGDLALRIPRGEVRSALPTVSPGSLILD